MAWIRSLPQLLLSVVGDRLIHQSPQTERLVALVVVVTLRELVEAELQIRVLVVEMEADLQPPVLVVVVLAQ
jgi:hypothetical protein